MCSEKHKYCSHAPTGPQGCFQDCNKQYISTPIITIPMGQAEMELWELNVRDTTELHRVYTAANHHLAALSASVVTCQLPNILRVNSLLAYLKVSARIYICAVSCSHTIKKISTRKIARTACFANREHQCCKVFEILQLIGLRLAAYIICSIDL